MQHSVLRTGALSALLLLAGALPASAAEVRPGERVVVGANETIDDDLYAFGGTVTVLGRVNGDVIAAGGTITLAGPVAGDVSAAGGTILVSGDVKGSVRLSGGSISISGPVAEDVAVAGGTFAVDSGARVGRDLLVGGGTANVSGPVGRNVTAGAGDLTFAAPIGGSLRADAGTVRLASGAVVQGRVSYATDRDLEIAPGAATRGGVERGERMSRDFAMPFAIGGGLGSGVVMWVRWMIGMSVLGLLFVRFLPGAAQRSADILRGASLPSFGIGLGLLIGIPILALVVFMVGLVFGGWWLAFSLFGLYGIAVPVGQIVVSLAVGQWILGKLGQNPARLALAVVAGLAVLGILAATPVIGGIAALLALSTGLGAVCTLAARALHRPTPEVSVASPVPLSAPSPA